jgi:hypothetical protein
MDIEYPEKRGRKDKAIAAGRAAAEQLPWVGWVISALGPILPDRFDADEDRWRTEVTDKLNTLARLHCRPTVSRDRLAWLLALLAAKLDRDGTGEVFVSHEQWESVFPDASRIDVEDALAELAHAGWIQTQPDANSPLGIGGFCGTPLLFAHTHPWVHQLYPSEDARRVAAFALETAENDGDAISADEIRKHFGWERRQLYPALAYLATEVVPNAFFEKHYHPEYPFIWLYLNGEVRRTLREYVQR